MKLDDFITEMIKNKQEHPDNWKTSYSAFAAQLLAEKKRLEVILAFIKKKWTINQLTF